jgi:hypothetical protein
MQNTIDSINPSTPIGGGRMPQQTDGPAGPGGPGGPQQQKLQMINELIKILDMIIKTLDDGGGDQGQGQGGPVARRVECRWHAGHADARRWPAPAASAVADRRSLPAAARVERPRAVAAPDLRLEPHPAERRQPARQRAAGLLRLQAAPATATATAAPEPVIGDRQPHRLTAGDVAQRSAPTCASPANVNPSRGISHRPPRSGTVDPGPGFNHPSEGRTWR